MEDDFGFYNMPGQVFLASALVVIAYMHLLFVIALLKKDNSIVDIGWGVGFILIAFTVLILSKNFSNESILVVVLTLLWGLRLAVYIFLRNYKRGEDYRYRQWREEWGKNVIWRSYLQIFVLQGFIMWLVALPLMNTIPSGSILGVAEWIGCAFWITGFLFESVGDMQMHFFKKKPENRGKIMRQGLWRFSRHPNYFGESLLWWGIFIISVNNPLPIVSIVSPILLTYLLLRVSGVALLEKKYIDDPEYQDYRKKTRAFVPWLPRKG
ncbi:MAG: hypothetical protein KatS3mg031_1465 [Chitinophagales bacterium]|nr:MAG: hypothetical protein KatS3mg031_1465 [Chitinophagales bacterium]